MSNEADQELPDEILEIVQKLRQQAQYVELVTQARDLYRQGDFASAIAQCANILAINENYEPAYTLLGVNYVAIGRLDDAGVNYDKALALNPNAADANYNKGNLMRMLNRIPECIACYRKAIENDPNFIEAYTNLGVTYCQTEDFPAAISIFDHVILNSVDQKLLCTAYHGKGMAYAELGNYNDSLMMLNFALELDPAFVALYFCKGDVYYRQQNYQASIEQCDKALEIDKECVPAYMHKVMALHDSGKPHDAIAVCDQVLALIPNFAPAIMVKGVIAKDLGSEVNPVQHAFTQLTELEAGNADSEAVKATGENGVNEE